MKPIDAKVRGWTPIFDDISDAYGPVAASVYGCIWRHCQMTAGVCKASHNRLATLVGVSTKTISRHLETLEQDGYIMCSKSPPGMPKHYLTTDKVNLEVTVGVRQSVEGGGTKSPQGSDNLSTKETYEETIEETKELSERKSHNTWSVATNLGILTGMDIQLKSNKGRLLRSAKQLIEADYSAVDILEFRTWWYENDWRGKKGQAPTLAQVPTYISSIRGAQTETRIIPTFEGDLAYIKIEEDI